MTGKEYLSQYRALKSRIRGKMERAEELRSSLTGLRGIRYDLDKVQSSPSGDRMANGLIKLEELADDITAGVVRMNMLCKEIEDRIDRMQTPVLMDLLRRRYIKGDSFEQIAVDMCYTYKTVLNYHGEALVEFEQVNDDVKEMERYGSLGNE